MLSKPGNNFPFTNLCDENDNYDKWQFVTNVFALYLKILVLMDCMLKSKIHTVPKTPTPFQTKQVWLKFEGKSILVSSAHLYLTSIIFNPFL